ncbi:hypothetical protein GOODEAATRI_004555, partial [Goodea atripinnis]
DNYPSRLKLPRGLETLNTACCTRTAEQDDVKGNGFVNPRGSPSLLSTPSGNGLGKILPTKSPPPPGGNMGMGSRKPDLRVVIPPSSKGMMPPLVSKEHTAAHQFHQPEDLGGCMKTFIAEWLCWICLRTSLMLSSQHGMVCRHAHRLQSCCGGSHLPQGSNLSISTSQSINIKSEPISPPRERVTPSGFPSQQQQPQQGSSRQEVLGRSPADSLSSSCSSYDGSDREDHRADFHSPLGLGRPPAGSEERESPSVKRLRMDTWVT